MERLETSTHPQPMTEPSADVRTAPAAPGPVVSAPKAPGPPAAPRAARPPAQARIPPGKTLDFVIIGAQRSGTTSLWSYLKSHPALWLPPDKEAPFFSHVERWERGFAPYLQAHFGDAPLAPKWGTASPHYMRGMPGSPVEEIARRMREELPDARLVAVLRDPVTRSYSQYRLTVRRGSETRSFTDAARELLTPEALQESREAAVKTNSYFVLGEYGRILEAFLDQYPREQLFIGFTDELEREPAPFLRKVLEHLQVDPDHQPPDLGTKYYQGGKGRLIDQQAQAQLEAYLAKEVWPAIPQPKRRDTRRSFNFWLRLWNTVPDQEPVEIEPATRAALEAHYRTDLARFSELTGLQVPWGWATA